MQTLSPKPLFCEVCLAYKCAVDRCDRQCLTKNSRSVVWDRNRLITGMLRHRTMLWAPMANTTLGLTSQLCVISFNAGGKYVTSRCLQQWILWWHLKIWEWRNERCIHHLLTIQDDSALEGRCGSLSGSRQCLAPRLRPLLRAARAAQPRQHFPLQRRRLPAAREGDTTRPRQLGLKHSLLRRCLQLCRGEEVKN